MTVQELQTLFTTHYNDTQMSRDEYGKMKKAFHNQLLSSDEVNDILKKGLAPETFNIFKAFLRMLQGYYSNVVNEFNVIAPSNELVPTATVVNGVIKSILQQNRFTLLSEEVKLDGFLSGLFALEILPKDTGTTDEFGRPIIDIKMSNVPYDNLVLDYNVEQEDFSDITYLSIFKWVDKRVMLDTGFKEDELEAYNNFLGINEAQFTGSTDLTNKMKKYLLIQSFVKEDGKWYSYIWHNETIKEKNEIRDIPFVFTSLNRDTYNQVYGLFREVYDAQINLNKAVIKLIEFSNTERIFVQEGAVGDIKKFEEKYKNMSKILPVTMIQGIKIDQMTTEIQQQLMLAERALDRVQFVLGINDSFLGQAKASDSGRKVNLQRNSSIMRLRHIDRKLDIFFHILGEKTLDLIKKYYTSHRIVTIVEENTMEQMFLEINKPLLTPEGQYIGWDEDKNDIKLLTLDGEVSNYPLVYDYTDMSQINFNLVVNAVNYDNEEERNQMVLETVLNGAIGQSLLTVNPSAYFEISSMVVKQYKTKGSLRISQLLQQTAQMLSPQPQYQEQFGMGMMKGNQAGYKPSPKSANANLEQGNA